MTNSTANSKGRILYFEDDQQVANMITEFLSGDGFEVTHFSRFPTDSSTCDINSDREDLVAVLMDIKLPDIDGYEACRRLLGGMIPECTPIVFISGLMDKVDVERAYEAGADDFLSKPVKLKELSVKLNRYISATEQTKSMQDQLAMSRTMAFEAMTTSSELGEILRFHEQCISISDFNELGVQLLLMMAKFNVQSSVMFFPTKKPDDSALYIGEDGKQHPLEIEILKAFHGRDRIFSWKQRTFFNYPSFSLLVKNMPIDDETRYGILKDQFCLLLNGIEGRVQSIVVEKNNQLKSKHIKTVAETIGRMVMEMEASNASISEQFDSVMRNMESNISSDIIQFNLLEHEEQALLNHVKKAINASATIFEESVKREDQYREIMSQLLENLSNANDGISL